MLPGGREKLQNMNELLRPMVEELSTLWTGVDIEIPDDKERFINVRAALLLVSCDLPAGMSSLYSHVIDLDRAGRKVCGFKSENYCCHKCHHHFRTYDSGISRKDAKVCLQLTTLF